MFNFLKKPICPNCQLGSKFPMDGKFQICKKCQAKGYDYQMYKTPKNEFFMAVYIDQSKIK